MRLLVRQRAFFNSVALYQTLEKKTFSLVVYVRTYLETFKQTLKTHNDTTEGKKQRTFGGGV